jgi:Domain of unknown function (DUF4145)
LAKQLPAALARSKGEKMNWTCPFCHRPQVVSKANISISNHIIRVGYGDDAELTAFRSVAIACLNGECRKMSLTTALHGRDDSDPIELSKQALREWRLLPESFAKQQPDSVPAVLVNDYVEACRIRDLSPKASATLARRCLQGMIRDFCGISKATLFKEIEALREQLDAGDAAKGVTHESVDAIDAVRSVGNIGAHMEKEVDLIVEIEPGEAQMLIELIEMLFEEWYVERDKRTKRLAEITALSAQKASELAIAKLEKAKGEAS